ncbi:MAG: hypothetical protein KAU21_19265 [Gammaproteobacteria bacterium]|nr:hypothetical protein [Gammaproteobacteria bacterium]
MNHIIAAYLFSLFTLIVVLFQAALVFGVPWGSLAMGGKYPGKFPPAIRVLTVFQILILICTVFIVLIRAGEIFESFYVFSSKAIWCVVVFSVLGMIMNTITPSKWERIIWLPVTIVLFASSLYVALN